MNEGLTFKSNLNEEIRALLNCYGIRTVKSSKLPILLMAISRKDGRRMILCRSSFLVLG